MKRKNRDSELLHWLKNNEIPVIGVYTKADKLSRNQMEKHARALDAGTRTESTETGCCSLPKTVREKICYWRWYLATL